MMKDSFRQGSSSYSQVKGGARSGGAAQAWRASEEALLLPIPTDATTASFVRHCITAQTSLPERSARDVAHRIALLKGGHIEPLANGGKRKRKCSKKGWSATLKSTGPPMKSCVVGEEAMRHIKRKVALAEVRTRDAPTVSIEAQEARELALTLRSGLRHIKLAIAASASSENGGSSGPQAVAAEDDPRINVPLLRATLARLDRITAASSEVQPKA
jgi:hypothetical protein